MVQGWVYWYRFGFVVMGLPPRVVGTMGCFFFSFSFFGVNGRLWVATSGGVRCV